MTDAVAVVAIAVALDLAFGDPPNRWHPVAWLGRLLEAGSCRLMRGEPLRLFVSGAALTLTTAAVAGSGRVVVAGGETLQPVLYPLAVEAILGACVVEGRLFFCTRDGAFSECVVRIDEGTRALGLGVLAAVDDAVTRGFLPAAPRPRAGQRPGACDICEFVPVCGPDEERRTERKDRAALDALRRLRGLP